MAEYHHKMSSVLYLDITLDRDELQTECLKVLGKVRPAWDLSAIDVETYSEGYVNCMVCLSRKDDRDKIDAIVIRVYGLYTDLFNIFSRETEFVGMQLGHAAGCFPPVLAVFNNGVAYQYAQGRTLTLVDLHKTGIIRAVTRKVVALDFLDVSTVPLVDCHGDPKEFDLPVTLRQRMDHCIKQLPEQLGDPVLDVRYQEHGLKPGEFTREFDYMDEVVKELALPHCLGHQDIHVKNILYDEKSGSVTFLDYEMFGMAYEGTELGYLFAIPFFSKCYGCSADEPEITADVRSLWLKCYLEAFYEHHGWDTKGISPEDLELADIKHKIMEIYWCLFFALLGQVVISCAPKIEGNHIRAIMEYKRRYFEEKKCVDELKRRYHQLINKLDLQH